MSKKIARILLVEPDPTMQEQLAEWLADTNCRVRSAERGPQARRAFEDFRPHLVIAAWQTPELDIPRFCRALRRRKRRSYVYVLVTSKTRDQAATVTAFESGADDVVLLPVERSEFQARVQSALRLIRRERRWARLAKSDSLTGLASRRTLLGQLQREWSRALRHRIALSCVMIDLDFFKRINDTLGHRAGDHALRAVVRVLEENCRMGDLIGRYGGEEFCVVLPETDERQAVQWANRVRDRLAESRDLLRGVDLQLTASFGVAERLADMRSPDELINLADQALLVAKRSGRDRVVGFQTLVTARREQETSLTADPWFGGLVARDLMSPLLVELREDEPLDRVARCFLQFRLQSAPVIDRQGLLIGIVSERDVMASMVTPHWNTLSLNDIMQRNVACYDEEAPVAAIHEFLSRVLIRAVVVTSDGQPVGMISRSCLFRWFANIASSQSSGEQGADARSSEQATSDRHEAAQAELADAAKQLAARAAELEQRIRSVGHGDLMSVVIAGTSSIEERLDLLLALLQGQRAAQQTMSVTDPR